MRLNSIRIGIIWLACCELPQAFSAEIYVSPSGNDAGDGSIGSSLATLAAARDKADQLKAGNTPVTVYLRGGTYYLSAPVVFGPSNSGTAAAPIRYVAYGAEKPVISGAIKVTSSWSTYKGKIMVTTIAQNLKVDQLFLDGQRQVLARYPNFDANQTILNGYAADCISASRINTWSNPAEGPGYIRGLHVYLWGGNSYSITGKSGSSITQQWVGDNNRGSSLHATYRMVENIFEELDAPGEWFYRKSTGQLFFYPPSDNVNLSAATIELASQDELLRFVGSAASSAGSVQFIQFDGVTFTQTFRTLFSQKYEFILQSDWAIARAGAVFMQNAENIRISNCTFDQIGGNGVFISGYNRDHVIDNNDFEQAGASCVAIVGMQSAVRCAATAYGQASPCTDNTPGPQTNEYPSRITVDNNTMAFPGRFEKQTAGVTMSMTEFDTVRHNTVHDCPRAGINFTDGCWGGHEVRYNWVYNSVLETFDHGPINAWGRDRNLSVNVNDTTNTELDAMYTTNIHHNRFESAPLLFGVDLDDGASNYNVHDNLILGSGIKLWHTRHNRYVNNIMTSQGQTECLDTWNESNYYVAHNITFDTSAYTLCCFADMSSGGVPGEVKSRVNMIDSNCIWCLGRTPKMVEWQQVNTVVTTWANWLAAGLDAHSQIADPQFVDTAKVFRSDYAPRGDFSVKPTSPALAIGFKNFPMDSFGVMTLPGTSARMPFAKENSPAGIPGLVRFAHGRLIVSLAGDYKVTVTNTLGRTVAIFSVRGARGTHGFTLKQVAIAKGVYTFRLQCASGEQSGRIVVQ
jgi:Right handed beta helix region